MFRCTKCASMKSFIINDVNYNLNYISNDSSFYLEDESTRQKINSKSDVLYFMNKTSNCSSCNNIDTLENMNKAYDSPIDYFDAENLCTCGEELWLDRIPNTNSWAYYCDSCAAFHTNKIFSGSQ